jgi:hypothetical protein
MERHEKFVGTCMVEDVVAWLPHSPMLAFDILQNMVKALAFLHKVVASGSLHVLFISLMCSPSFVLGYGR